MIKGLYRQLQQIWRYLDPQTKRRMPKVIALVFLVALLEMAAAGMLGLLGASMTGPQTLILAAPVQAMIKVMPFLDPIFRNALILIPVLLTGVVVSILGKNIFTVVSNWSQTLFGGMVVRDVGSQLFKSYLSRPYSWHLNHNVANLQTHLSWVESFYAYISHIFNILTSLTIAFFLLILTFVLAPVTALLVFGITGIAAVLIHKFTRNFIARAGQRQTELLRQQNETSLAGLQGFREILIFQLQRVFTSRYMQFADSKAQAMAVGQAWQLVPALAIEVTGAFTLLLAGITLLLADESLARLTGTLTLVAAVSWRLLPMANRIVTGIAGISFYQAYIRPVLAELADHPSTALPSPETTPTIEAMHRGIALEHISFRYPTAERDSLSDISLSIPKGQMVGIIGTSGAGKSTLVAILTGLLSPERGQIRLDDQLLDANQHRTLGNLLGYVPQSSYLLDGTLAENIAFKDWGHPIDYARVQECCTLAAIDFLDTLPKGLDTPIGERGTRLSGGQVQRVVIARALYHRPQIILFDEATSALDSGTEATIQRTVLSLRQQMTVVMVAHRLSTVETCDIIYWLEDGRLRASGPPSEILPLYLQSMNTV